MQQHRCKHNLRVKMSKLALCLVLLCWWWHAEPSLGDPVGTRCGTVEGAPSCVCRTPSGGVIDLTKIASYDGTPRFTGLRDPNTWTYDYNPCISFQGKGECGNVHICQSGTYDIAANGTEEMWIDTHGQPYIHYTGPRDREVFVSLICDHTATDPVVTTTGDSEEYYTYEFTVRSVHACPSGNLPPDPVKECEPVPGAPSCVCRTPDGVIDLTKLASYDGTPRFSGVVGNDSYLYDYNPCAPFKKTNACNDVYACQRSSDFNMSWALGDPGSEQMGVENGQVALHYSTQTQRKSVVYLKCSPNSTEPTLTTTGDSRVILLYEFILTSCHACPGGCSAEVDDTLDHQDKH